eukprot:8740776-Alexandrium_andersonii.AAC.1
MLVQRQPGVKGVPRTRCGQQAAARRLQAGFGVRGTTARGRHHRSGQADSWCWQHGSTLQRATTPGDRVRASARRR